MKIRQVGAESLRADRQSDRRIDTTKLVIASRSFANIPKNGRNGDRK